MMPAFAIQPVPMRRVSFARPAPTGRLGRIANACSSCGLRELCLPCGLRLEHMEEVEGLVYSRRRVRRGEFLYRAGDVFESLYTFRTGFFKSSIQSEDGRVHVTGFQMPGDILGLDGIDGDRHRLDVVALDDAEVCVIPYAGLIQMAARVPELQRHLHKSMSREIIREQGLMLLLGTMRASARVAAFLLNLSQRFADRGYSASEFNLRMTREEVGSYLGLKLETVSRVLSRFQERGLISTHNRYIKLCDAAALRLEVAEG